jgi:putative endonuclease
MSTLSSPSKSRAAKVKRVTKARKRTAKSKPAAFVYVLGSFHKGRYTSYVGWTNDVTQRLAKHNNGTGARSTRGRVWTLLHTEPFKTRNEAMSREWHLKRDRAFRKKLMDAVRATL